MKKAISYSLLFMLSMMIAPSVAAQVTRVNLGGSGKSHDNYVDVYEYDFVDVQPRFPGDERGLVNYINNTRQYPYDAYKNKIQGRVVCSFIVNTDGSICHVQVIKSAYPSRDKEAVRIIKEMPNWKPGMIYGEEVPVHCILPIAFRL